MKDLCKVSFLGGICLMYFIQFYKYVQNLNSYNRERLHV